MQPHRNTSKFCFKTYPVSLEIVKQYARLHSRTLNSKETHRFLNWIASGLTWFCLKLSWKAAYNSGTIIGTFLYYLRIRRKVAMVNLDIVFGQSKSIKEKEYIYKVAMINIGRLIFNYIRLPQQPPSFWQENVRITNMHILEDALKENRGVIALAAHLGIIDLAAGCLGQRGYPIAVVGKRIKHPFWDEFVLDNRLAMNVGTIRHRSSMKRIFKGLKVGEIIVMALDQNMRRKQGTFLNWMGRPASSVYASGYLAQKLKVPIVAGYCWQKGPKEFETIFTEQVPWQPYPKDPQKEILINAQAHADAVQRMILSRPEIWFWIHKRWRIQPAGVENPYG